MAQHMAQQNAEGSRDLSTLVDASAELQHLVQTIWRLRQPDGCPWDREQTHRSIGKNMIEEAYEALDCIEADDAAHLREELGDVLMQVVLHAQIAADAGEFTLADVARDIDAKLIRRHPHVFGDADAESSDGSSRSGTRLSWPRKLPRTRPWQQARPRPRACSTACPRICRR